MKAIYKYRLDHLLGKIPRNLSISEIENILEKNYGIKKTTFRKHRKIEIDSKSTIYEDDLFKYAQFFKCSESEIRNYEQQERKSIFEILKNQDKPIRQLNLKLAR